MSEYQYYEFVAVDRPLDDAEFAAVRALSTRARMSRTHFVNDYQWGDFKGSPRTLVERYYDAHLYFANWGSRHLMLKLPAALLDLKTAARYEVAPLAEAWKYKGSTVLSFTSDDEYAEWDDDLEGALSGLIGVRAELAAGDLRPLYLAWLAGIGTWERDEDTFDDEFDGVPEPALPAGLSALTGPQQALADFLRLDGDLLAVAAEVSPACSDEPTIGAELRDRIAALPDTDKDDYLLRVAEGSDVHVRTELLRRYRGPAEPAAAGRTVAQLLNAAAERRQRHEEADRRECAAAEQRRAEKAAQERERCLTALAADVDSVWLRVDALIAAKKPREYDQAVELLQDLRELAQREGTTDDFTGGITRIRDEHARKPALIARLDRADLGGRTQGTDLAG
ncbi:hypothetical protein [Embleya sp. NPDC020630]|uniref:hypothetical protein n=1 Tax=Embleya sp. NPDC020630 TaxID=3363979 RepID=UPI00378A2A31